MQVRLMLCFAQSESSSLDCMSLVEPKSLIMAVDAWNLSVEHVWLGAERMESNMSSMLLKVSYLDCPSQ